MKFPDLSLYPVVSYDTETTGLRWWSDKIFGVSIAVDGACWYWDVRKTPQVLDWLRKDIPRVRKLVAHHAKYDWHFSREAGIVFPEGRVECTMIRAALIDEHRLTYDLDSLGKDYVGVGKDTSIYEKLAAMFGGKPTKQAQGANFYRAPESLMSPYAKQDADTGLKLWQAQELLIDQQELRRPHAVEMRLLPAIVRLEHHGVRVDIPAAERAVDKIDVEARHLQKELDGLAGFCVNVNSGPQMHKLFAPVESRTADGTKLWTLSDGTPAELTDGGRASIDADCLRRMKDPRAVRVLDLRKMMKARDTFLKGHILGHHHNEYVHANFNQTKSEGGVGTGTGRLSVNDPALQQIPKRDKLMAAIVRAVFLPDRGDDWVCNDWAQMDFRIFAHYVNIPDIIAMYRSNPDTDFHSLAATLTGLPRSPRFAGDPNAKQINLGLVFGMGKGRLAQEMGLPYTVEPNGRGGTWIKPGAEAEAVFEQYHGNIHGVDDFLKDASSVAKSRGYVKTIIGRRIRFPRGQFTHKAGGLIFQGTAAEALKQKIIELDAYFQSEDDAGTLLLNVHDEFDCSIPKGRVDVHAEISRIVTGFGPDDEISFRVPIRTEQGVAENWHEASK